MSNSSLSVHTLILGGGLTGLSTAYHLEKKKQTDYLVVEQQPFLGGLSASETRQGFTFDCSGHLLHLHDPYALRLVRKLLKNNLLRHKRRAFIDLQGRRIPFPFQANLWALPTDMRQACVEGAIAAAASKNTSPKNFEQWCLHVFGAGIYRYFLQPYNQKLWQTPLTQLTWDWCGSFVPTPDLAQITRGAKRPLRKKWGYNAYFYYPKRGGCGALAQALADYVPNIWLSARVTQIDLTKKQVLINGKKIYYQQLINTLPLPDFLKLCTAVPASVTLAASDLKATTVQVLQVAIGRKLPVFDWIYFPDKEVPFYRVGMQSAFSLHNAPAKTTSLYIETARKIKRLKAAEKAIFKSLVQKGIIKESDPILFSFWRTIRPAYVVYDTNRAAALHKLLNWLQHRHIFCAGRYGLWEYSFMERSLLQGRELAEQLTKNKL